MIIPVTRGINFPIYTNYFIAGTTVVIDNVGILSFPFIDLSATRSVISFFGTGTGTAVFARSLGRLSGVSTINDMSVAIVKITANNTVSAYGPWDNAEAKSAGITIFHTDANNYYGLTISPAATTQGGSSKDVQLTKVVAGVLTSLDTDITGAMLLNTEYILTLERVAGVVEGKVYSIDGTLISTVSASDTALSTGNTGMFGYGVDYIERGINIQ